MKRIFWIDIHYATFLIESTGDIVTDTAPIVKWMIGKDLKEVKKWLISKGGKGIEIKQ